MSYTLQFGDVWSHLDELLAGAWLTLRLSAIAMAVGLLIAIVLATALTGRRRVLALPVRCYVELIRNTPFLIQVMIIFFGLPSLGIRLQPNQAGLIAMIVYVSAYSTEIVRAGIEAVPAGQVEAARALGFRIHHILAFVIIPRALRVVYPALTSQFILIMLSSSILSVISAEELSAAAANVDAITFRTVEVYIVVAAIYFSLSSILHVVFMLIYRVAFSPLPISRA